MPQLPLHAIVSPVIFCGGARLLGSLFHIAVVRLRVRHGLTLSFVDLERWTEEGFRLPASQPQAIEKAEVWLVDGSKYRLRI